MFSWPGPRGNVYKRVSDFRSIHGKLKAAFNDNRPCVPRFIRILASWKIARRRWVTALRLIGSDGCRPHVRQIRSKSELYCYGGWSEKQRQQQTGGGYTRHVPLAFGASSGPARADERPPAMPESAIKAPRARKVSMPMVTLTVPAASPTAERPRKSGQSRR